MPTPFDPSKLDLDINNTEEVPNPEKDISESTQEKEVSKSGNKSITEDASDDVLGNIEKPDIQESEDKTKVPSGGKDRKNDDIKQKNDTEKETKKSVEVKKELPNNNNIKNDVIEEEILDDNDILSETENEEVAKIIDINLTSLEDIVRIIKDNEYDFVILEPNEKEILVSFRKNQTEKQVKYIKYSTYTTILLKIKQLAKISVEVTEGEKEGKGKIQMNNKVYDAIIKITPGTYGEKAFLKIKENTDQIKVKKSKKTNLRTVFGFLGAVVFVALILGGAFITFIILNAQTVEDVRFFSSLGINLNDINAFISRIVTFLFSLVVFIETSILAVFLFKFILTKKEFKKKRVIFGMISTILLIITFITASSWIAIDARIKALPNWQELAYGDIQIFDNDRLTSEAFDKGGSLLIDTENLIGPMTIKYDLSLFEENEERKGLTVRKYTWNIGGEIIEEFNPTLIKEFIDKGNYEVSLTVEETDVRGETIIKEVENIPSLSIAQVVEVQEEITRNGGKIVEFDGSDLEQLGRLEWYFATDLENPVWEGYTFKPSQIFFEETVIALNIVNESIENQVKVFVVGGERGSDIQGQIFYERSLENDLEYTLRVEDPQTAFGDGFIEQFEWQIGEKTVVLSADPTDLEGSSEIEFEFTSYGNNEVSVVLSDASGKTNTFQTVINIPRNMKLRNNLDIFNEDEKLENVRYVEKGNEYFVDELGIPTTLKFDARFVRPENLIYSLREVTWDFENDNSIDANGKTATYEVFTEGNHTVSVNYKFVHRTIPDDVVNMEEFIYIEGIKKEAVVDFKIEKDTDYVPVTVRFDASRSTIKDDDVVKFEYDYGDGIVEVRDAINPGHIYTEPGDYTIKLTITGRSGKKYSVEKQLILKPEPQDVKIGVSIKNAPVGQGIDFSSEDSDGQIIEYFWDFGDGNTSVEANPTHAYAKAGTYEVTLRVDFANSNSLVDTMEIKVY